MQTVTLSSPELQAMMIESARLGAQQALDDIKTYNIGEAAQQLGVSFNTLKRRIAEGKIKPVDGRITGAELRRYLSSKQLGNR